MSCDRMIRIRNCSDCFWTTDGPTCKVLEEWASDENGYMSGEKMDSGIAPNCPLEIAPQNGWTPLCFTPSSDGKRCINPSAYGMSIEDSCMSCPYRKKE